MTVRMWKSGVKRFPVQSKGHFMKFAGENGKVFQNIFLRKEWTEWTEAVTLLFICHKSVQRLWTGFGLDWTGYTIHKEGLVYSNRKTVNIPDVVYLAKINYP